MEGYFSSDKYCRTLLQQKLEILDFIKLECKDLDAREFYTEQIKILIDSLEDFIDKKHM